MNNGIEVPCRIIDRNFDVYELEVATDKYLYYATDDRMIMLDYDHQVITDNYFAEVGLIQSIDAMKEGKEHLVWCSAGYKEYIAGYEK